jgi:predicted Zn-dependent peptidase
VQIVSPHYARGFAAAQESLENHEGVETSDTNPIDGAAKELREIELESAQPAKPIAYAGNEDLNAMSIDELREFAASLRVPNRAQVVSRDELIAAIRGRD